MENFQAFKDLLSTPQKVVIVTHFKPDADALGSSLGLAGFLARKGHSVQVITPSDYPDFLSWMPGNKRVLAFQKESDQQVQLILNHLKEAEILFCLDFSGLSRIHDLGEPVRQSKAVKVMVDHHLEPEKFADFECWNVHSASTAGLIYELIRDLGETNLIDTDIANCLYAGLMTDTGGFRHNNTRHEEFEIASALVARGAKPHEVAKQIYDTNSLERLRLTGFVLANKLNILPEFRTAYITLTAEELAQFGAQTGDTEGLVNYGLSIKGVKLSVLMYDRKDEIKLSFRSLNDFSVNAMARKYFNGGGHRNASGGNTKLSLDETLRKFLAILPEYKNELMKD
jgi:phosphoesterase RecJ-like protein